MLPPPTILTPTQCFIKHLLCVTLGRALGFCLQKLGPSARLTQLPDIGKRTRRSARRGTGGSPPLPAPPALHWPAAPPTHGPGPFPRRCVGGWGSSGPQHEGLNGPPGLQAASSPRRRGGSAGAAGPKARSIPPRAPPPRILRDSEERDGNKYLDFEAKVNGNCHSGATWALGFPAPPVLGQAGRGAPLIGWLAWPPRRMIGCVAQMTSSALSEKPAGRPLCSYEPIAGMGRLTSPPAGLRWARTAKTRWPRCGAVSQTLTVGGVRARPGCW